MPAMKKIVLPSRCPCCGRSFQEQPDLMVFAGMPPAERRVAWLAGHGLTNQEIARTLGISDQTVKNHMSSAFERLGMNTQEGGGPGGARRSVLAHMVGMEEAQELDTSTPAMRSWQV